VNSVDSVRAFFFGLLRGHIWRRVPHPKLAYLSAIRLWGLSNLTFRPERATDHLDQPHGFSTSQPKGMENEVSGICLAEMIVEEENLDHQININSPAIGNGAITH
jgi:hypothetical protein